jgi:hypothetical protein
VPQKLLFVYLKPVSGQFLVVAYHVTIYTVKAQWTELVFILFVVLLIVALLVKDMCTIVTYHSFVIGDGMVAEVANQIADVTMKLCKIRSYD